MGTFSTVSVDRDHRLASVGGGTRIRDLLKATLGVGLYTPMGSCGSVGVAGLTLAGGAHERERPVRYGVRQSGRCAARDRRR
jgi:FAD/FMN-containing dehydrogenase